MSDTEVTYTNTPRAGESEDQAAARLVPRTVTTAIGMTEGLIETRGKTHGDYSNTAKYIQQFKAVAHGAYYERRQRGQPSLTAQQKESLEMILHKCGRILSGDASFDDHWADIAGYAKLANKEF